MEQVGHAELPQSFDPQFTQKALEMSLERLGTDRVDVYGLHNPKMRHIHDDESFGFLNGLIREGKVGALQVALGPAIGLARRGGWRPCPGTASPPCRPSTTYWSRLPATP